MAFNGQEKRKSLNLEKQRPLVIFERAVSLKWEAGGSIKKMGCDKMKPADKCLAFETFSNERKKK